MLRYTIWERSVIEFQEIIMLRRHTVLVRFCQQQSHQHCATTEPYNIHKFILILLTHQLMKYRLSYKML